MTFDATSREFCTVRRVRTNTPLQALTGLNDEAFFEAARALASRARARPARSPASAAREMFRLVASRQPTEAEVARIVQSYERQTTHYRAYPKAAARVVGAEAPEKGQAELAAWTLVANLVLCLDEVVTKN